MGRGFTSVVAFRVSRLTTERKIFYSTTSFLSKTQKNALDSMFICRARSLLERRRDRERQSCLYTPVSQFDGYVREGMLNCVVACWRSAVWLTVIARLCSGPTLPSVLFSPWLWWPAWYWPIMLVALRPCYRSLTHIAVTSSICILYQPTLPSWGRCLLK